ncbi:MAG: electron transfer flavoprotein subunit alpha/FixB family protein [Candidatus Limnocylindria bacterium]
MSASDVWFLAEFVDGRPARSALELATGAASLVGQSGGAAVALAYGEGATDGAALLGRHGARRAITLGDAPAPLAATVAPRAAAAIGADGGGVALLAPATPNGRDLAAAVMGLLGVPALGPVRSVEITDGNVQVEQATLGGTVMTRSVPTGDGPAIVVVATNTFTPEERGEDNADVTEAPSAEDSALTAARVVESNQEQAAMAALEEATTIIAGGRGLGGAEGFEMLRELAGLLNGAVGATRAAADAGWIPFQLQIGQTGKTVKPSLYLAVGISGAIQHRVGMQAAEHVVAINRDPDAPIAEFADLFVVGDLFQIVPKLTEEIRRRKGG